MKKRILLIAGLLFLLLGIIVLIGWWWLTATRSGAMFVLGQVQSRVERLEWTRMEGGLRGGIVLYGLEFEQAGLDARAERVELTARVRPAPPFDVRIVRLEIEGAQLQLPPADPDAPSEAFVPGDYRLPVPIRVDAFVLSGLDVQDPAGETIARIDRAALAGAAFETLEIERFEVAAPQGTVRLDGQAELNAPWTLAIDTALRPQIDDVDLALDLELGGPLDALEFAVDLRGDVRGRLQGALRGLPDPAALSATVEAEAAIERWPGLPGRLDAIRATLDGRLDAWTGTIALQPALDQLPVTAVTVDAEGGREGAESVRLEAELLGGRLNASGRGRWVEPLSASARLDFDGIELTSLYPDWPDQVPLTGGMNAGLAEGVVTIDALELRAPPTPLRLTGQANYRLADNDAQLALEWTDLVWPPVPAGGEDPLFRSATGRFEGRGTLDEWQAEIDAWLQLPDQPRARIEVDAGGDQHQATISRGLVQPEQAGRLAFSGQATLDSPRSAALDLELSGFDPAALLPQLPGRVDGVAALRIGPGSGELQIASLSGQLRGQPLGGDGVIRVREQAVTEAELHLALGENRATVQRPDDSSWVLDLDLPRLDQLWPDLAGALRARSTVRPAERSIDWTLDSPGVILADRRSGTLASRGEIGWGERPSASVRLTAENVDLNPWERLERVELSVTGDCALHRINAYAGGARATLDLAAGGSFEDCDSLGGDWSGRIDRLSLAETPLGLWQLDEPLSLRRADGRIVAGPGCLWTTGNAGRLCLNQLDAGPDGTAGVAFNAVPMDLLLLPLDPAFTIDSTLRGLARVRWDRDGLREVDSRLVMDPGAVRLLGTDGDLLTIDAADLALSSPTVGALRADLVLAIEGASEIRGRVDVPEINDPASSTVDGRLALNLPRLSAFNRLVPQLDALEGRLDAELTVAGALTAPDFDGEAQLTAGRIHHAPLGLDLEAIDLTLHADESGGRLDGRFRAGEGQGRIAGNVAAGDNGWRGQLDLAGDALALFDASWLKMQISPDLDIGFDPERVTLGGSVRVDAARLGLPPGAAERIEPSRDVVIAGLDADPDDEANAAPPRPIHGAIRLELGDDVRLDAAGMRTRLAGALDIAWPGDRTVPVADGRIELLDGAYRAYGQNLEVRTGEVVFTGHPIDNPVLDVAAVREIFGDPVVEYAGVEIRGPAQDPEIELFTTPPTSREKALAYVLTGAEFDHAAGQGAFNVGLWVLPNVFVSYGVGLFDTGNVLAARWDLSRRWGLRATSGESDTGADVSFIIDR